MQKIFLHLIISCFALIMFTNIAPAQTNTHVVMEDSLLVDQYHLQISNKTFQKVSFGELVNYITDVQTFVDDPWVTKKKYELYEDDLLIKSYPQNYFFNTYEYDADNRLIRRNILNREYTLYTYDSNDNLIQVLNYWSLSSGDEPNYKMSYQYDENNFLISSLYESWYNNSWNFSSQSLYTNNENGKVLESIVQYYSNGSWSNNTKYTYTYDSNGFLVTMLRQNWSTDNWANYYLNLYSNFQNGSVSEYLRQYWKNESWQNSFKETYVYNEDEVLIEKNIYSWQESQWLHTTQELTSIIEGSFIGLLQPYDEEQYLPNEPLVIQWIANGLEAVNIDFSSDNGNSWSTVASNVPDSGNYDYNLSLPSNNEYEQCKIKVSDITNPIISDENDTPFNLIFDYDYLDTSTETITMTVQADGSLGPYSSGGGQGEGFRFMDFPNALFSGGIIMGNTDNQTVGMVSSFLFEDMVKSGKMPQMTSNGYFDEISLTNFDDSEAPSPYNVDVTQKTYSKHGDPYIYIVYDVLNYSLNELTDFYIGMFLDWDIGSPYNNNGGYEEGLNLIYQFDENGSDTNYYGVVALNGMSGARLTNAANRGLIIDYMSSFLNETITQTDDYRSFIGSGPFSIPIGSSQIVGFAILAGQNLDAIMSNAETAQSVWDSGIVNVDDEEIINYEFTLSQNYPNPFNPSTSINYSVPKVTHISLKVYDILGRVITTLVDDIKQPGNYKIEFNGNNLASGVYFYTLQYGSSVISKKMILIK